MGAVALDLITDREKQAPCDSQKPHRSHCTACLDAGDHLTFRNEAFPHHEATGTYPVDKTVYISCRNPRTNAVFSITEY
eukprot:5472601-Pleurochrysis_carterae.AAC.2